MTGYEFFLQCHHSQLERRMVPSHFWKTVYEKCSNTIFDAGDAFSFEEVESNELAHEDLLSCSQNTKWKVSIIIEEGISSQDSKWLYLIDHAYTYDLKNVRCDLLKDDDLRKRVANLLDKQTTECSAKVSVDDIITEMWRYNQAYNYSFVETQSDVCTVWYIMDELGTRIRHSEDPTFRIVPFLYMDGRISYTLLFPVKDLSFGDEVTRNYVEGEYNDELSYNVALLPWKHRLFTHINCHPVEPDIKFLQSGRVMESLPDNIDENSFVCHRNEKLKVYCDYSVIQKNLRHPAFELTSEENVADILWYNYHFKDYKALSQTPHVLINQFPFEHILTSKDLLAVVARRTIQGDILDPSTLQTNPPWLPTTYNLKTELCEFVSYFQQREIRGFDNYWIIKPWNRARGADIHITNDLACIIRLRTTSPKVACKYVIDPVLFPIEGVGMVKMDIRYIILLKQVKPLKLYAYKHFWLRFANKPFALHDFDDYEKHFTVMNYNKCNLKQMFCEDFIEKFQNFYHEHKWSYIENEIFKMFKELFVAATCPPPSGLFPNLQSRAMYGIDLMLQWNRQDPGEPRIQPVILEVNWSPDCQRACDYYPDFFNDVFDVLFHNNEGNTNVVKLLH